MNLPEFFKEFNKNIDDIIEYKPGMAHDLWKQLLKKHPADIAYLFNHLSSEQFSQLFGRLPNSIMLEVFPELSVTLKVYGLHIAPQDHDKASLLRAMHIDELTDLFEHFSDLELRHYLGLLNTQDRKKILSLLKFHPESAGGIMDPDVLTFTKDFTVEKAIHILQRIKPNVDLHHVIYITNEENKLVGYIHLEDLVLKSPSTRLGSILRKIELKVNVDEDREEIAQKMVHYGVMTVPVVGPDSHFLGIIPSDTLVDIIEKEATENVYKMAAMTPIKYPYFETPFFRILYERSYILIALLLAQTVSSMIIDHYNALLSGFLISFITMLISTGGNTSSQTSAVVIQGMASGDITNANVKRFLRREFAMAFMMAVILGFFAFVRVWLTHGNVLGSIAVSTSLALIVLIAVLLGSFTPLVFKRFNIDPAFAAGPFLATLMDVVGLLVYCYISSLIL